MLCFRTSLPSLPFIHGCYQRNLEAGYINHGISFLGHDWLVLVDEYSKYPCIHMTGFTTTKATTQLLEHNFDYFGYSHTFGHWQCNNFYVSGVSVLLLGHSPQRSALPSSNQWGRWAPGPDVEEIHEKVEVTAKETLQEFLIQYPRTPIYLDIHPGSY